VQDQLNKIESKVDKVVDSINEINITLAKQHVTLQEHMKRSEANEKAVEILATELKEIKNEDIAPIAGHVIKVELITKIVVWLIGLAATAALGHHYFIR
jgi:hypothetical protein